MPLTRSFRNTVKARAERDPEFRFGLFRETVDALLSNDLETGNVLLRDHVSATVGFETLAAEHDKSLKSLMRMLSDKGNPCAGNLLGVVGHLTRHKGAAPGVIKAADGLRAQIGNASHFMGWPAV